jgi:hypothetical protein
VLGEGAPGCGPRLDGGAQLLADLVERLDERTNDLGGLRTDEVGVLGVAALLDGDDGTSRSEPGESVLFDEAPGEYLPRGESCAEFG